MSHAQHWFDRDELIEVIRAMRSIGTLAQSWTPSDVEAWADAILAQEEIDCAKVQA